MRPVTWMFEYVFGYGHAPGWALHSVFGLWVVTTVLCAQAYATVQMAPETAMVLTSAD